MKYNVCYVKNVMTFSQLACDLENQGLRCEYDDDLNILFASYLNFDDRVGIKLSKSKYWKVYFYDNIFCRKNKLVSSQATQKAFNRCIKNNSPAYAGLSFITL
jgi:hypothetical protein